MMKLIKLIDFLSNFDNNSMHFIAYLYWHFSVLGGLLEFFFIIETVSMKKLTTETKVKHNSKRQT